MQIIHNYKLGDPLPKNAVYVGIGTPFGEQYDAKPSDPNQYLQEYCDWLLKEIENRDPVIITALAGLTEESVLVSPAPPQHCHAEIIECVWSCGKQKIIRRGENGFSFHENKALPQNGEVYVFDAAEGAVAGNARSLRAYAEFGAQKDIFEGRSGQAYALPIRGKRLQLASLETIRAVLLRLSDRIRDCQDHFFVSDFAADVAGFSLDFEAIFPQEIRGRISFANAWKPLLVPGVKVYAGIGSRKTPPDIMKKMSAAAGRLSQLGYVLRSGAADGADSAFEARAVRKEIYLPWPGFNKHTSSLNKPSAEAYQIARLVHPGFDHLSDAVKKLMARNSHQILGSDLRSPCDFVLAWTPDALEDEGSRKKESGGTGQAIALASRWGIPVFNMANEDALDRLSALIKSQSV